jgi:predicted Mrr-cat superfamily restriction endonuclease
MVMTEFDKQSARVVINVWKVAAGEHAFLWKECLTSGCITINWLNDRNFNDFHTEADIKRALSKEKDGHGGAPYIWSFVNEIQPGHFVVANNGLSRVEGIGRVLSKYLHPKAS